MRSVSDPNRDKASEINLMMNQYGSRLLRLCCMHLGDYALAEDAVQETLLKAYKALDAFRSEASELTWLTRIAINTCRNLQRNPWQRWIDRSVDIANLPEPSVSLEIEDASIREAVMRLPIRYREVLLLRYYNDLSVREVALALSITESCVNARLQRARRKLKPELEGWLER